MSSTVPPTSIRFWLALCALVRIAALLAMPLAKTAFLNREMPAASETSRGYSHFLERRTDINPLTEDERCYDEMAQNICRGRGFVVDSLWVITTPGAPAMYGGCGYPLFVAAFYKIFGIGRELPVFVSQIALQTLALWFIYHIALALAGSTAATAAAAFFTFHPVVIWLSVAMMSEAVLLPGMAALIYLVVCRAPFTVQKAAVCGALLGFMALTRSTASALVWATAAWMLWFSRSKAMHNRVDVLILVFVVTCAPWSIRNYVHWHRFIPFSTKSGVNAWFFNHPGLKVEFSRAAVEGPQPIDIYDPRIQSLPDEAARNDRLMSMFKEFFREQPGKFFGLCWMRFWMAILPARITSTSTTALISAWYAKGIPLLACAAAFAFCFRKLRSLPRETIFPVLIVLYWQAIQTLAGPGLRYRLPVEPAWAILVGIAAAVLLGMLKARTKEQSPAH